MNKFIYYISTFLLGTLSLSMAHAQEDWGDQGEIEDAQIVVEKDKDITLPKASRKFEKIDKIEDKGSNIEITYDDLTPSLIELQQVTPRLRVLKVQGEKPKPIMGNYIEAGFGNYVTPYLRGHFNSKRNSEYAYGAVINHISSKNGPVDYSGMSSSEIGIHGDYFLDDAVLKGELFYNNDAFRYYGFNADSIEIADEDDIKQNLNNISSKVGVKGNSGDFSYQLNAQFNNLSGKNDLSDLNYGYQSEFAYQLAESSSIGLGSDLNMETAKYDSNSIGRVYFTANPYYKFLHNGIHFTVGVNTAYDNDTITEESGGFHIYPHVFANYPVFVNELNIFAGLTGGLQNNTLTSFTRENQWYVMNLTPVFNNNKTLEIFGGLKGNFDQKLGYKAQLAIQNYRNLHFFINNPLDTTTFTAVTDSGNTSIIRLSGELTYEIAKKFMLGVDLQYNQYSTSTLEEAFHRPTIELGINAMYMLHNKVFLKGELNYLGGLKGYSYSKAEIVDLNDIIDLNFEIDYKFSDNFSSFVMLNNVFASKYQYYLNYPNKGFNAILGVSYSF